MDLNITPVGLFRFSARSCDLGHLGALLLLKRFERAIVTLHFRIETRSFQPGLGVLNSTRGGAPELASLFMLATKKAI